ncbi:MAG TPA: HAMP domain-containing sensor histidine kinase [Holophagaceae bacterium]|nr:HAMP domain-containing sensor histidine kinase [Holophagaceae bacterium]
MSEPQILLTFLLATGVMGVLIWAALGAFVSAKRRIVAEQQKTFEAERQAARARQAFMDNAHHELKTPLQIIQGNLDILTSLAKEPELQKYLQRSQGASRRLHTLIQGLLDLTDLSDGTYPLRSSPVDLRQRLEDLATEASLQARAKGLTFRTELDLPLVAAWMDAPCLERALGLLLDNALAYTEQGEIVFRARTRPEGTAMALVVEIDDTGPGLPAAQEGTSLAPFLSGAQPLSRPGFLGLGLPLTAGLVRRMGGRLELHRLFPGTRARVSLTVPVTRLEA